MTTAQSIHSRIVLQDTAAHWLAEAGVGGASFETLLRHYRVRPLHSLCVLISSTLGRRSPVPEPELIGPFPVEPPPGSPEAVAQAAEILSEPYDPAPAPGDESDIDDGPDYSTMETDSGEWYAATVPLPEAVARAAETVQALGYISPADLLRESKRERDELVRLRELTADLETSRLLCGRLADALEACREVLLGINKAHIPGRAIPGFDTGVGALMATEMATEALRKAERS